jgi:hypothetical protein
VKKHENVPEQDGEGMTHKQVFEALRPGRTQEICPGHYGKRTDMGTAELGVVLVMVVVGASPNAARREGQDAKDSHEHLGQTGAGQYRVMLLIVINYKKPENQQSAENTTDNPAGNIEIPESPRNGRRQKQRSGENVKPTPRGGIHRKSLRR